MRTMVIFRGLPGCGKSTEAAAMVRDDPKRWVRINRDDLRGMSVGPNNNPHIRDTVREKLIHSYKESLIRDAFSAGYDVIIDDTNLIPETVKKLHQLAAAVGDVNVIEKCINVPVETCIARDLQRSGFARVTEKVIRDMARGSGIDRGRSLVNKTTYYDPRPSKFTSAKQDESLPQAIMCDLDGTLALMGDRSPYDATDCDVKDMPNWPVIRTVMAMHAQGVKVIFMSGRDVKYRPETVRFINKYCRVFPVPTVIQGRNEYEPDEVIQRPDYVIPYELHMRGELDTSKVDQRKDSIIKQELFDAHVRGKFNVLFVLDDRDQVVDFWRSIGLTCFQVAPGCF